ncbi:DNRLRE domain-containing protein, partial [Paenibacillus sp. MCAF20]
AGPSTNMNIYNNTFYLPPGSTTSPIVAQAWNGGNPVSSYFYNNIFYLLGSGAWTGLHLFTTLEFDYNTFYGVHASGEPSDAHKLTTDPLLVNAGSGGTGRLTVDGYKLRTGSPALGSVVLMANNGGLDYWGNSVSNTANPNRGAYNGAGIVVNSTTLTPAADAFIYDGSSVTNYGSASYLLVKDDAAGYKRRSYLKFNLSGISTVSSAKLRLYGNNTTDANTVYVKTYGTTTNSWTETGINWNNAPAITTSYLSSIPINSTPAYYEFDVTSFVQAQLANGTVSLVVLCNVLDGKYIQFNSKEATVNRPQLVIQ